MTQTTKIEEGKRVFVNRTLNLNAIKLVGFDMDYTTVTYNVPAFEELVHTLVLEKLIKERGYPSEISQLKFDPQFIVRGLVLDVELGNILKVNCFGYVKRSSHGTKFLTYEEQRKAYRAPAIDLMDSRYYIVHTLFSLAEVGLFAQLVTMFDSLKNPQSYRQIFNDIRACVDDVHQEGTMKTTVIKHPEKYLIRDEGIVEALKKLKRNGKKLALITNSDYDYSKSAMNYCFFPYLDQPWQDLFDIIIVASNKPAFFQGNARFLKVDRQAGYLSNFYEPLRWGGIYQGGNARTFEKDLGLNPSEILYLGDHLYGDVVTLKEAIGWRTGLIVQELEQEVQGLVESLETQSQLFNKMIEKEKLEDRMYELKEQLVATKDTAENKKIDKERDSIRDKLEKYDDELRHLITAEQKNTNPYWGEIMRAGIEESRFAPLVERYACIYTSNVANLRFYSPFKYFRPSRRLLAHDPHPLRDLSHADE